MPTFPIWPGVPPLHLIQSWPHHTGPDRGGWVTAPGLPPWKGAGVVAPPAPTPPPPQPSPSEGEGVRRQVR
jgi:hypothetical protein